MNDMNLQFLYLKKIQKICHHGGGLHVDTFMILRLIYSLYPSIVFF